MKLYDVVQYGDEDPEIVEVDVVKNLKHMWLQGLLMMHTVVVVGY